MEFRDVFQYDEMSEDGSRHMLAKMRELINSPAWKYIEEMLRRHYHERMAAFVGARVASMDAALAQEYDKGLTAALTLLWTMPETLIAHFETNVAVEESRGSEYGD